VLYLTAIVWFGFPGLMYAGIVAVLLLLAPLGSRLFSSPILTLEMLLVADLSVRTLVQVTSIEAVNNIDDVMVLIFTGLVLGRAWVVDRRISIPLPLVGFSIFVAFGLVSALARSVPTSTWLAGAFLPMKGVLVYLSVSQVRWSTQHLRRLLRDATCLAVVVAACAVVNVAAPGPWSASLSVTGDANERYGLPSLIGPFIHPFDMAMICSLLCIVAAATMQFRSRRADAMAWVCVTLLMTVLTFRRKELIGLVLALSTTLQKKSRSIVMLVAPILLAPLLIVISPYVVEGIASAYSDYVTNGSRAARTVLTSDSLLEAQRMFPLGLGFGRFGSRTAQTQYSPDYVRLGYAAIWGLQPPPGNGHFLTDTQWPAIVGESGMVGGLGFGMGLVMSLREMLQLRRRGRTVAHRVFGTVAVGWWVALVTESLASAVFSGPPGYVLFFGVAGISSSLFRQLHEPGLPAAGASTEALRTV